MSVELEWFIREQNLRHFRPDEILFLGDSHHNPDSDAYGLNSPPPEELWENAVAPMRVIDNIREIAKVPCAVLSGYRSNEYNAAIGGSPRSQHKLFRAFDIKAWGATPRQLRDIARELRESGMFTGGIGLYSTFIHIDNRGTNADW